MLKSLMAAVAVAGTMALGAMDANAGSGHCGQSMGGHYAANYNQCAQPCPVRTPCVNYNSNYRDCTPRYVAGQCMKARCGSGSGCNSCNSRW